MTCAAAIFSFHVGTLQSSSPFTKCLVAILPVAEQLSANPSWTHMVCIMGPGTAELVTPQRTYWAVRIRVNVSHMATSSVSRVERTFLFLPIHYLTTSPVPEIFYTLLLHHHYDLLLLVRRGPRLQHKKHLDNMDAYDYTSMPMTIIQYTHATWVATNYLDLMHWAATEKFSLWIILVHIQSV